MSELPKQIDQVTILQSVEIYEENTELAYEYVITSNVLDRNQFDQRMNTVINANALQSWCSETLVSSANWTIRYNYRLSSGALFGAFTIQRSDCQ